MSKNRVISDKQERNDGHLIIEERKPFHNTNKRFKEKSIVVTFSYEDLDNNDRANTVVSASGIDLTTSAVDFLMKLFPGEFERCIPIKGDSYLIKSKKSGQQDDDADTEDTLISARVNPRSQQKKLIKVLAALPLIAKITVSDSDSQFATMEEQKRAKLCSLITNVIRKNADDESVSLSTAFKHYDFFIAYADDFINQKDSNYHVDLTLEQKNNLAAIFPLLQFHRYEPKEDEFKFMIKKDDENATVFDKLPHTLPFIQKWIKVRTLYNRIPVAEVETREPLLEMITSFEKLTKAISADASLTSEQTAAVYEYFTEPLDAIIQKGRPLNLDRVAAAEEKMNRAFNDVPPVNKRTRTAISAAKVGMLGFISTFLLLGFVAAAITTGGAFIGVGIVGILAIEAGLGAGFLGGAKGYMSAQKEEAEHYSAQRKQRFTQHKDIYNKVIDGVTTFFPKPRTKPNNKLGNILVQAQQVQQPVIG